MSYQKLLYANNNLYNYNCVDILEGKLKLINDKVDGGSFNLVSNGDGSFTFWGTVNTSVRFNLITALNELPSYFVPGETYYFSNTSSNI